MSQNKKKQSNLGGFTLVEVMVSSTIFMLAIASFFQAFSLGFSILESVNNSNNVTQTMQSQMENLRGVVWADFVNEVGTKDISASIDGLPSFKMEQSIVRLQNDHYKATLVASWESRDGQTYSQTFVSWFSKDGLNSYYTRST